MTKPDDEGTMGDGFKPAPVPDNEAERLEVWKYEGQVWSSLEC